MVSLNQLLKKMLNRLNGIFNWVTEEYDFNGWHVVKYRNGWCKLYYRQSFSATSSGWNAWGNAYVKDVAAINYPVIFESVPFQSAELQTSANSGWLDIGWNTVSDTGHHQINRPSSGTNFNAWIIYRVYGRLGGTE